MKPAIDKGYLLHVDTIGSPTILCKLQIFYFHSWRTVDSNRTPMDITVKMWIKKYKSVLWGSNKNTNLNFSSFDFYLGWPICMSRYGNMQYFKQYLKLLRFTELSISQFVVSHCSHQCDFHPQKAVISGSLDEPTVLCLPSTKQETKLAACWWA